MANYCRVSRLLCPRPEVQLTGTISSHWCAKLGGKITMDFTVVRQCIFAPGMVIPFQQRYQRRQSRGGKGMGDTL